MIDVYYWPTPNGHKVTLFLEEAGLPYTLKPVDITKGEQFKPEFLRVSPNNKIPAIVDHAPADGGPSLPVFESGAILLYLAEKTGRFLPRDLRGRVEVTEWLVWQVAGFGPMLGQNHHFSQYAPVKIPYAIERYQKETSRLYAVLDRRLEGRTFIGGNDYSIADMATYPWALGYEKQGVRLEDFPNVRRWLDTVRARPATQAAYAKAETLQRPAEMTDEARRVLFGQSAETLRKGG